VKHKTSFSLSEDALSLLRRLAQRLGLSQASVIELLIRERAEYYDLQDRIARKEPQKMNQRMTKLTLSAFLTLAALRSPAPAEDSCRIPIDSKIFIAPMPEGLGDFIAAEVIKRKIRVTVLGSEEGADYVLAGTSRETGDKKWYDVAFGTARDKNEGSIKLLKASDKSLVWAAEAGDRSLLWGSHARSGQRKVASRLVDQMKDELCKK